MITNRKENKCPKCGASLKTVDDFLVDIDETGLILRNKYECDMCHTFVWCRENYALCDIEQTKFE